MSRVVVTHTSESAIWTGKSYLLRPYQDLEEQLTGVSTPFSPTVIDSTPTLQNYCSESPCYTKGPDRFNARRRRSPSAADLMVITDLPPLLFIEAYASE